MVIADPPRHLQVCAFSCNANKYLTVWSVAHIYRAFGGTRALNHSLAARVCVQGTPQAVHMGVFANTVGSVSHMFVFFFLFQFQT
jgi:hypothetical protein